MENKHSVNYTTPWDQLPKTPHRIVLRDVMTRSQSESLFLSIGQRECDPCGEDDWSNAEKSKCVPKHVEFLAYEEALGFTLVILSIFGALVVLAVTVVYVIHRHTPLVKANDRELSFLIQVSLGITVLSSMLFIGKPCNWSCKTRQVTLALGFCLCYDVY